MSLTNGIDEGRYRLDYPWDDAGGFNPAPGSFRAAGVRHDIAFDFHTEHSTNPAYFGDYTDPPDWKEFIERRWAPGDNVIVTLFEGESGNGKIVDRITYTELDVVNREIDEKVDVRLASDGTAIRDTLLAEGDLGSSSGLYMTFWPNNTMGVDFYRTLERKAHPAFGGDRFGTSNRWEATDGNYDDWSHEFIQQRTDRPDIAGTDPQRWKLRYHGSPLQSNWSSLDLDDVLVDTLDPDMYGDSDGIRLLMRRAYGSESLFLRNSPLVSLGDIASLPYTSMVKSYTYDEDTSEFGTLGVGDALGTTAVGGPALGLAFPDDRNALAASASFDSMTLTCGQADFHLLYPDQDVYSNENQWPPLLAWGGTPPQIWRPGVPLFAGALRKRDL